MEDLRAFIRAAVVTGISFLVACGTPMTDGGDDDGVEPPGDDGPDRGDDPPLPQAFEVRLVPNGASSRQRVSFAIPFARGALPDDSKIRIVAGGLELPAARRTLARYSDGSPRSVQLQADVDLGAHSTLRIELGAAGAGGVTAVPVETLLAGTGGDREPRVWVVLPPDVMAASGLVGSIAPRTLGAWSTLCDYERWDTDAFVAASASRDVWLYDRVTTMYRGYAITGEVGPLRSAYREAGIYRAGIAIANGVATSIGVPTAANDLKYHYSQGLALHYLLTGDDRYREAAEAIAARVATMWDPHYDGDFWTERHAGFALLAHEWALRVTDDRATEFAADADDVVTEVLALQAAAGGDPDARCFAHTADSHGEGYGTVGCSPWMSAILADGLDAHAERTGGARAEAVRVALVRLGRMLARHRDGEGRPFYWMATSGASEVDPYEEHWGESAYVVALAWRAANGADTELRTAADQLIDGLRTHGEVGHLRSFNWQCRSAVLTPALLR